jgi:predicted nucleic acid-binding protein
MSAEGSGERFSLDANLLFYAIDDNDPVRHERAVALLEQAAVHHDCIVALQAYCEFFAAVTRKHRMPGDEAAAQIADWQTLFTTVYPQPGSLPQAITAVARHNLSFWDAMLWSVVRDAGATVLLSEDFQSGRELGGVRFRNPFSVDDPFGDDGD